MGKIVHLEGQQFGYLTVIKKSDKKYNSGKYTKTLWDCRCVCGKEIQVDSGSLLSGNTRSCGCMKNKYDDKKHELGKKYGKLTVINVDNYYDDRKVTCQCECGTIKKYKLTLLKKGHTTSCGCLNRSSWHERGILKDEVGNVYGKLTVIAYDHTKRTGSVYWKCRCECGNEVVVSGNSLRSGNTRSCGCMVNRWRDKKEELGKRYGKLVVISVDNYYENGRKVLCQCDCGNTTMVKLYPLKIGNTKSCGCIKSRGEYEIKRILENNGIEHKSQFRFDDLRGSGGGYLYFDFAIFKNGELSCLIEFDGNQHNGVTSYPWDNEMEYLFRRAYDTIKTDYCYHHDIPLIRIKYSKLKKLEKSDTYLLSLIAPYIEVAA